MEQLTLIEPNQDIGDTTSNPILDCKNQPPPSAIVESQVPSSETISKDKSNLCEKNIQEPKSLKTLFVPSTISVVGLNPYWNSQCVENNSKLWLPTETDSQDLDSSLSNGLSKKTVDGSWFSSRLIVPQSKSSQTTCLASSTSFRAEGTDLETVRPKMVYI
jgi:hypothetical protein